MAKVLVVDDAAFMRVRAAKVLEDAGHEVAQAENGLEAIRVYAEWRPDVVLMDITMPEMDGLAALKEIRKMDPSARVAMIRRWAVTPDHASVNWHESGAEDAARALLDAGVDVHAGLFTGADVVGRFLASALRDRVARVLVEITEADVAAGMRGAEQVLARLAGLDVAVLLHGEDATCWPALVRAAELGLDARIGLEDTLLRPDGTVAAGNVDLAEHAVALLVG